MTLIRTNEFQPSGFMCIRLANGFDFEHIEAVTGILCRRIARFESGIETPTIQEIKILADLFGVLPHFFKMACTQNPEHIYNFRFI